MMLGMAIRLAAAELLIAGSDGEVATAGRQDRDVLLLGLGFAVGKGFASYRGDGCFRITTLGALWAPYVGEDEIDEREELLVA